MGENTSQIERDIYTERDALGRNLEELEVKAKSLADWRTHYRNHATIAVGAVFVTALAAGALAGGRRSRSSSSRTDYSPAPRAVREPREPREPGRARRHVEETWNNVSAALLGVATTKAMDILADFIPGFREEYQQRAGVSSPSSRDRFANNG